jgi:hypothetical protein
LFWSLINAFGGLGGLVGTYIVGALGGGTSAVPFIFLAAWLFLAAILMFAVRRPATRQEALPSTATARQRRRRAARATWPSGWCQAADG